MQRRFQKKVTISPEQVAFAKANYGKMNNTELAKMLGIGYGKTLNNLIIMGIYNPNYASHRFDKKETEMFDVDNFSKQYNY